MLLLKRIFAILTLVALIAASLLSSAECWIYQPRACAVKMQSLGGHCHGFESSESAMCGSDRDSTPCHARKAASKCMMPVAAKDCEKERDCRTKCFRLLSDLLADRPNRVQPVNPDPGEAGTVDLPGIAGQASHPKTPDDPPPWGIHPSVATTVLRI